MWHDRIKVVKRQSPKVSAITIVLLSGVAWFAVSNHCGLAVLTPTADAVAVHARCHGASSGPAKKNTGEEVPCCKVLRATIAANVEVPPHQQTGLQDFVVAELFSAEEDHVQPLPEEIDTGPPFASSYAELILQRSVLAHAPPPFSLS
jgi:hypothetical protein